MTDSLQRSGNEYHVDRPSWDITWLTIARTIAKRSLCDTAAVGAVVVDSRNRPISMGYNGPPSGFRHDNLWCNNWCKRGSIPDVYQRTGIMPKHPEYNDCPSLHAEQNALITADKSNFSGGTIYVSSHVCSTCAKLIANSGLKRVVILDDGVDRSYRDSNKWYEFLKSLHIKVNTYKIKLDGTIFLNPTETLWT